jgi:hypothetical protein
VKRFFEGVPRDALFTQIFSLAQDQARAGRYASKADGGVYRHALEGQLKADLNGITLLGDKKGAGTAWQFARRGLNQIENFKLYIDKPVKMLHVIRNPFDIVAAGAVLGRLNFPAVLPIVAEIRRQCFGSDWLDIYHEDVIANPRVELVRILEFLGLPAVPQHLDHCVSYLYQTPHRRRFETPCPTNTRERVEELIARHDFLGRYTWES